MQVTTAVPARATTPGDAAETGLGPEDEARLLDLAREALGVAVRRDPVAALEAAVDAAADIDLCAAAFVTLFARDALRGCMGTLDHDRRVTETVALAALLAATEDPRFRPLGAAELPGLRLEVSVLSRPAPLRDPAAFVAGRDGIIVERDGRRGLLLPQVAEEHGLDATGMLRAGCEKAGLRPDAWRDPGTRLSVFHVVHFGGPAVAPGVGVSPVGWRPPL